MNTKWMLGAALVGHLLCWYCDRLLICAPGGKFAFADMKDNEKMRKVLGSMRLQSPILSIVLGTVAMFLEFFGYLFLSRWMSDYSALGSVVMLISAGLIYTAGMAHHALCGAAEWMYIRQGCTEEARKMTTEFFKQTSLTMILCYVGILAFSVAMLVPVISGRTALPIWAAVFNLLPLYLAQAPFRVPGAGNLAGAVMYTGLLFLI